MLDLLDLPVAACLAHIIPGLASHSLISVVTLCNAGCDVLLTKIGCTITHCGRTIMCGSKCMRKGLWMIPLQPGSQPTSTTTPPIAITAMAANVAATSTAGDHAHFIHQAHAHPRPHLSYGPSHKALNSQPSQASLPALSCTTSHHQRQLIRAICDVIAKVSNLRTHNNQQSCKPVLTLIDSNPLKK